MNNGSNILSIVLDMGKNLENEANESKYGKIS
jgi:hypothetical protein